MARILRGEVYWADLNPVPGRDQAGMRPVPILSRDLFNRKSETAIRLGNKVAAVDADTLGQLIDGLLELVG